MKVPIDLVIEVDQGAPVCLRFETRENAEAARKAVADQLRPGGPPRVAIRNETGSSLTIAPGIIRKVYVTTSQPLQYPFVSERTRDILGEPIHAHGPSFGISAPLGAALPPLQQVGESVLTWPCGCTAKKTAISSFQFSYLCSEHCGKVT